jgi:hypothetical protein
MQWMRSWGTPSARTNGVKKNPCRCWKLTFPPSNLGVITMVIELYQLQVHRKIKPNLITLFLLRGFIYIYIYIYMCVCVCVCVWEREREREREKERERLAQNLMHTRCSFLWSIVKMATGHVQDSKQTRVKTVHFHPATCNLAHWLTRRGSATMHRCFLLPQLLYRWRHQSGKFWIARIYTRMCVRVCVCVYARVVYVFILVLSRKKL